MCKIRIAIVEDDPVWLNSMAFFLNNEKDMSVISTASSMLSAIEMARNTDIDIILMDINLSENKYDGIYAAAEICQFKKIKIIMLTSLEDEKTIINSFTAGAVNYISKSNYNKIPFIIRSMHNICSPIEVLLKEYSRLKINEQMSGLTTAEKELIGFMQQGYTQPEISNMLFKTQGTIKSQVNKILKKFGVTSCKEVIRKINTKGLL